MLHRRATTSGPRDDTLKRSSSRKSLKGRAWRRPLNGRSTGEEFFIINIPEIRRAAIRKNWKKKKRVQTTGKQLRGGGGEIEKIIVKNILGVATTSCKSSNELISNGLGSEIIFFHYYLALWRGYVMLIALFFSNGSLRLFFPPSLHQSIPSGAHLIEFLFDHRALRTYFRSWIKEISNVIFFSFSVSFFFFFQN